jgi:methyl-accepting chemotaxis protein
MFGKLTIAARLTLGFGAMLFITLVIGVVGVQHTAQFADQVVQIGTANTKGAAYLADAQSALWQLRWDVAQFIAVNDAELQGKLMDDGPVQAKIVEENFERFEKTGRTPEEVAALSEARQSFGQYMAARPKWFELYGAGKSEEAAEWRAKTITTYGAATVKGFAKLIELQRQTSDKADAAAVEHSRNTKTLLAGLLAVALALGVAIAFWITRSINAGVARAVGVAEAVAHGDLSVKVEARSNDELGRLMQALRGTVERLAAIVGRIKETSDTVGTASREIAQGNADLSTRTEQQASALEETSASMQQMAATVGQNAQNAKKANELAARASQIASHGGQAVAEVVGTMTGISDSSKKIGDIIGVIDGIAFQTNILALNAAVEAARAGEQGRGFAVVAAEVRGLAQRSGAAAKEIRTLITDSVGRIEAGCRQVDEAGTTIGEIVDAVQKVSALIAEITAASEEQAQGIEQVSETMTQLEKVTQQNAAMVEEASAAAGSLEEQSCALSSAVAAFRLGDEASACRLTAAKPGAPAPAAAPDKPKTDVPPARRSRRKGNGHLQEGWQAT